MLVFVVAWHYNGGAGFDWYYTADAANKAFEEEKVNAVTFADNDWTAYRFDFNSLSSESEAITEEIDSQLDELSENAAIKFPTEIRKAEEKPKHTYQPECMCIRCQGWRRVCSEIGIPAVHCLQYERFGIED